MHTIALKQIFKEAVLSEIMPKIRGFGSYEKYTFKIIMSYFSWNEK